MDLPIKLVDLVTLLFICLLVVIIVFIILQRNIKRYKIRNVKDPHFLTCKSIPKELKDAILRKHQMSHAYSEPVTMLSSSYQNLKEDKASSFITRMKAFETSRNLEYALCDFGYRRPSTTKFEEFIETLTRYTDEALPTDMLKEFHIIYLWAMFDPKKFDNEELRKLNKLINRIIDQLAANKKSMSENLIQHKLDLNDDGDFDFTKKSRRLYQSTRRGNSHAYQANKDPKEVKFSQQGDAQSSESEKNYNRNNNNNNNGEHTSSRTKLTQFAKSIFSRKSVNEKLLDTSTASSAAVENEANNKLKEKLLRSNSSSSAENTNKYVEMQDISLDSSNPSRNATLETVKNMSPNMSDRETDGGNRTNRWSMTNESIKGFDSENEEIPLVTSKKSTNHQKKKSGHSIITVIPNTTGSATSAASKLGMNPSANVVKSSKPSKLITDHHDSASASKKQPAASTSSSATSKTCELGAENEGFNETNF